MRKAKDVIAQKRREMQDLQSQSGRAIDLVTSTINELEQVNQKIDEKMDELQILKSDLLGIEDQMNCTRLRNVKIMDKFRALVEV